MLDQQSLAEQVRDEGTTESGQDVEKRKYIRQLKITVKCFS
jgi:hypothetical protein